MWSAGIDQDSTTLGRPMNDVRRRTAELARQPTVWAASTPKQNDTGRTTAVLRALPGTLMITVVPPVLLTWLFGPVSRLTSWAQITAFVNDGQRQNARHLMAAAVAAGLWLVWLTMVLLLIGSLLTVLAGRRFPRWRLPASLHRMLFGLAGTAVVAVNVTPPTAVTSAAPATTGTEAGGSVLSPGTVTMLVGDTRFEYDVKRGDTLSKIARRWLGDADRWPEICQLNKHRHQKNGARLTDCDLIRPGWRLRLPADATPPASARTLPPKPAPTTPRTPPRPEHTPTTPPPSPAPAEDALPPVTATSDDDGLHFPTGSRVTWTLAAAISATVTAVWLRRRRHRPTGDLELPAPAHPEPVDTIDRHTRRRTAPVPPPPALPAGPIGLDGPGSPAAVRALIIAAVTATEPGRHTDVIIDRATCADLLGPHLTGWPRLQITRDFPESLAVLDAQLLHRSRLLADHNTSELTTLREQTPDLDLPLLLLVATAADADGAHARNALPLARGLDITAVLLGPWPAGTTHTVTADGRTAAPAGHEPVLPARVSVLEHQDALALLALAREADTGEPATTPVPQTSLPDTPDTGEPAAPPVQQNSVDEPNTEAPTTTTATARVRVLGAPRIDDITRPGRSLRAKAAELAVFLACHPAGADSDTLVEHLHGDARIRQAKQQLHTNASNLRHVLARAGGELPGGYLLKRGDNNRYRLDPATVQVDLWQLRDLLNQARRTSAPERTDLLRRACDLYTAPLADGCDYEWIEDHRRHAHRWGVEAHLRLAEDLLTDDPKTASGILDKAIDLDPYNEDLYRTAMRARHTQGDLDGVHALLTALTTVLKDIDAEPTAETVELARTLRP
jgi:DNA-binding SARP family transcriptional activator